MNRRIKTFVKRKGRITPSQQENLDQHADSLSVKLIDEIDIIDYIKQQKLLQLKQQNLPNDTINFAASHTLHDQSLAAKVINNQLFVLEIGCGSGVATIEIAQKYPHIHYIATEVYLPGIGSLIGLTKKYQLININIINIDAIELLIYHIQNYALFAIHIFFPDPWHKKRHNKRRIIQQEMLLLMYNKLCNTFCNPFVTPMQEHIPPYIHIATDCFDYANWIINQLTLVANLYEGYIAINRIVRYIVVNYTDRSGKWCNQFSDDQPSNDLLNKGSNESCTVDADKNYNIKVNKNYIIDINDIHAIDNNSNKHDHYIKYNQYRHIIKDIIRSRPITKFEQRALNKSDIFDFVLLKKL